MGYYFATTKNNLGSKILLNPKVPKSCMHNEDNVTPRICVSQSINGCLTSIGANLFVGDKVYIYECKSNKVKQPTLIQVPDRCFTGEQWILKPTIGEIFLTIIITEKTIFTVYINNEKYDIQMFNFEVFNGIKGNEKHILKD